MGTGMGCQKCGTGVREFSLRIKSVMIQELYSAADFQIADRCPPLVKFVIKAQILRTGLGPKPSVEAIHYQMSYQMRLTTHIWCRWANYIIWSTLR